MDTEKLIKSNQEQAVASWLNYLNQIRINRIVESLQQQNENLQDAVVILKDTMQTIDLDIIEKNRGGQKGQHGFIAEVAECGIGNAFSKLKGGDETYSWVNDNGSVDLRRGAIDIQQKFVRSGGLFSLNAVQEHHNKYPDFLKNGEKYQIPKDFYDNIVKLYNMGEKEAYKQLSSTSDLTLKQWRRVHEFFESGDITINDLEPSTLKYDEVQAGNIKHTIELKNQNAHKENTILKESDLEEGRASLEETGQAALTGAVIEGGTTFVMEIIKRVKSGQKIKEFTEDDWKDILKKSGISTVKGGVRGASIYMITNFTTAFVDVGKVYSVTTTPAAVASALVTAGFGVAEQIHLYREGKLSELDVIENSEILCLDAGVSAVSSLIGQAIIPIPVLGAVIGNSVGTVIYQIGKDSFNKKENEFFERYICEQAKLDETIREQYDELIRSLNDALLKYYSLLEEAFSPVPDVAFSGSIKLAKSLNVPMSEILHSVDDVDLFFEG